MKSINHNARNKLLKEGSPLIVMLATNFTKERSPLIVKLARKVCNTK